MRDINMIILNSHLGKVYSYYHLLIHQKISSSSKQKLKGGNFIQFGFSFIGNKIIQTHSVLFLEKYLQIAARKCSVSSFRHKTWKL